MKTTKLVPRENLAAADLVIDAFYAGVGTRLSAEPISELLKVRNVGDSGFYRSPLEF